MAAALAMCVWAPTPAYAATISPEQTAAIDRAVTQLLAAAQLPGLSIAVEKDHELLYARGYGFRDVASEQAVDADTYFSIGAVTEQFTAAAISLLVQDGKLRYDDRVGTFLPDAPHANDVTIRELLNHTSGLRDYRDAISPARPLHFQTVRPKELYQLVANQPLNFKPGTGISSSDTDYIILGAVIERVTGQTYADFLRKRVFKARALSGISYGAPIGKSVALNYDPSDYTKPVHMLSPTLDYAVGALYATPSELVLWDDAFFNGRIVTPAAVRWLTKPPALPYSNETDNAAGWIVGVLDGYKVISYRGGTIGSNTSNAYFPKQHLSIAVCGNGAPFDPGPLTRAIFRTFVPANTAQVVAESKHHIIELFVAARFFREEIARKFKRSVLEPGEDPAITARVKEQWTQTASGQIDTSLYDLTNAAKFPNVMTVQIGERLRLLGPPTRFRFMEKSVMPEWTAYTYRVLTSAEIWFVTIRYGAKGKIVGIAFTPDKFA